MKSQGDMEVVALPQVVEDFTGTNKVRVCDGVIGVFTVTTNLNKL